eukprot:10543324-Alexandrium_andersonii.AAC.1
MRTPTNPAARGCRPSMPAPTREAELGAGCGCASLGVSRARDRIMGCVPAWEKGSVHACGALGPQPPPPGRLDTCIGVELAVAFKNGWQR